MTSIAAGADHRRRQPKLRVDVYVEQRDVPFVHVGDVADVTDGAQLRAHGEGARSPAPRASSIRAPARCSSNWRSITRDGFLVPGSFAYVTLHVPVRATRRSRSAALITRGANTFVADVGDDRSVHIRPVKVAPTDGIAREPARRGCRSGSGSRSMCRTRSSTAAGCGRSSPLAEPVAGVGRSVADCRYAGFTIVMCVKS